MVRINREQLSTPPDGRPMEEQPKWRRDFPIDWPQDDFVARRDFTKFMVLTSFALLVGQGWIVAQNWMRRREGKPEILKIADLASLPVGNAVVFDYPAPRDTCILVRTGEDRFVAYSQKCTHLTCAVQPDVSKGQFVCPCHHGYFDMATGRPIAGPPRRPLPRIALEIRGDSIYATGVELRTV